MPCASTSLGRTILWRRALCRRFCCAEAMLLSVGSSSYLPTFSNYTIESTYSSPLPITDSRLPRPLHRHHCNIVLLLSRAETLHRADHLVDNRIGTLAARGLQHRFQPCVAEIVALPRLRLRDAIGEQHQRVAG